MLWAFGEPGADLAKVRAAVRDLAPGEAKNYFVARQDVDGYNADIESQSAVAQSYYFTNLYGSKPAGHAMLRDPRVKANLIRYSYPPYWREKGWPAGCRPIGETDFECGLVEANTK